MFKSDKKSCDAKVKVIASLSLEIERLSRQEISWQEQESLFLRNGSCDFDFGVSFRLWYLLRCSFPAVDGNAAFPLIVFVSKVS